MGKNETNVMNQQDPFGTERFNAIKAKFGEPAKLPKLIKGRFENIVSVFGYRTSVAHELHHAMDKSRWERTPIETRLAAFKSVDFFISSLQALLDEKIVLDNTPRPKPKRSYGW